MKRVLALAFVALVVLSGVARASDDPEYQLQYGPQQIYAPEAWSVTKGAGVTIAVVDTGVQLDHPDLRDKIVPGYDFYDDDDDPSDLNGHGTHVAGIAAAITDNRIGIAGVAPDAKIMPIRVLGENGSGSGDVTRFLLSLQQSIDFAVTQGAKVINLSLGEAGDPLGPAGFDRLSNACRDAFQRGSLCVAAAGNDGKGKPSGYAQDFQGLLVAANDRNREIAGFSQKADSQWSVTAPGVAIESTWIGSGYANHQGTSMAAPHVSGVAALLFAQGLSNQQVVDKILSTATPLNDGGGTSGAGLINAAAAVGASYTAPAPPTTNPAAPATTQAPSATGAGAKPSTGATPTTVVEGPVELEEGTVEEEALAADSSSELDFEATLGDDSEPEPISYSDGITKSFVAMVVLFVAILGAAGFVLRRVALRRGIGEIRV